MKSDFRVGRDFSVDEYGTRKCHSGPPFVIPICIVSQKPDAPKERETVERRERAVAVAIASRCCGHADPGWCAIDHNRHCHDRNNRACTLQVRIPANVITQSGRS